MSERFQKNDFRKRLRAALPLLAIPLAGEALCVALFVFVFSTKAPQEEKTDAPPDDLSAFLGLPTDPRFEADARTCPEENPFGEARDALGGEFAFSGAKIVPADTHEAAEHVAPVRLENGDLFDRYGGGREYLPENEPGDDRDRRLWIDARVPVNISSRLKLYGVSTLTLGDARAASTVSDYAKYYGIGGGLGLSFRISPSVELNLDLRRTHSLERSDSVQEADTDSAGISLKIDL